jgi:hypothetical protein
MLLFTSALAQESRLQQVRDEISRPADSSTSNNNKSTNSTSDDDDSCLGELFVYVLLAPFVLPHSLAEDDFPNWASFPRYPYQNGDSGYLFTELVSGLPKKADPLGVQLAFENGNDFNGMNRTSGHLLVETSPRLGFQTDWNWLHERFAGGTDNTLLGDWNLTFRFAQHPNFQFRAGIGARVLTDSTMTKYGYNLTYGADFFPAKPWIVSGCLDAGTLGSAGVVHARGSVGLIYRGCEIFTGYDFLRIGSERIQGPLAGLRFWF